MVPAALGVAYDRAREQVATVNADFQEGLSGVRVAQAYAREDRNVDRFRGAPRSSYRDARLEARG